MTEEESAWQWDDDPWAGMVDEAGTPLDIEPAEQVAAKAIASGAETVRLLNLPEEFWGSRNFFKTIRQAARADGTSPDAVLGAALARCSAMVSPRLKFRSNKIGSLNLFVNVVAPTGIGKTEAMRTAMRYVLPPTHLLNRFGEVDFEKFRDGVSLGTGEGMAEAYMGMLERATGELTRGRDPQPKMEKYRAKVRDNAFLFLDEGEALTKMLERKGATVGMTLRTAWTGGTLGQANAQETTTRFIPDGTYSMGILIGYQPKTAQQMLSDAGGGTPQRFLWLSALDPDMPDWPEEPPEPIRPQLCDGRGHALTGEIEFPLDIKRALWLDLVAKNRSEVVVDELHSHEPLMRCKLSALLCVLDGRMLVDHDDWRLAGMIWAVSCAVRDRLVEFGRQEKAARERAEHERYAALASAAEVAKIEVNERVVAYATQIALRAADSFEPVSRGAIRRTIKYELRKTWDAGLEYAAARRWVVLSEDGSHIEPGDSTPRRP